MTIEKGQQAPEIELFTDETGRTEGATSEPTAAVQVRVLLFSVLREEVGREMIGVTLPTPATGANLLDALEAEHPALAAHRPTIRLAVNQEYAPGTTPLADGDEVALITPVSGG